MSSLNINVLVSAKEEYLTQMLNILIPFFRKNFKKVLEESQLHVLIKYKLRPFQKELRSIQNWNDITLNDKVTELTQMYPYFYDLLKAIFIIHVKILSSIKINPGGKELKIQIPQLKLFIHKLFIDIARKFYYEPNIILKDNDSIDSVIYTSIIETLRSQIPLQNILHEYLNDAFDEDEQEEAVIDKEIEETKEEEENEDEPGFDENDTPIDDTESVKNEDLSGISNSEKEIHYEPTETVSAETEIPMTPQELTPPPIVTNPPPVPQISQPEKTNLPTLFNDAKTL